MPQLASVSRLMNPRKSGPAAPVAGAFDAMQALQAAYGLYGVQRLVSSATYSGYAYRAQRSSDSATLDCAPGTTALTLAAWIQAAGAAIGYAVKFYDQSGNARDSDTGTAIPLGTAPTIDCSVGVYPVFVFNGTAQRMSFSALINLNTNAVGITHAIALQATGAPGATAFAQVCTQTSGGNTSRTSIDMLTTPTFSARATRVDAGGATSANTPTSWDLNPHVVMAVIDYSAGTVKRYVDGVQGTQATFTALAPSYGASAAVFIGGANTSNFAPIRWTCSAFYGVATTGATLTALEAAMEAAA